MLKIKNDDYAFFKGVECRFWKVEENLYRLQTSFKEGLLRIGFKRYDIMEKDKLRTTIWH